MEVAIEVLDLEELIAAASLLGPAPNNPTISPDVLQILHKHAASSAIPPPNRNSANASLTDETKILSNCSNATVGSAGTASRSKDSTTSLYPKQGRSADADETLLEVANLTVQRLVGALGAAGPGLVAVRGFPRVRELRQKLLPFAQSLALMPHSQLQTLLKDNGLGTDVQLKKTDRSVSSFAAQVDFTKLHNSYEMHDDECKDLDMLGDLFSALGTCFVEVGLLIARLCDIAFPHATLEQSILESGTAKGRLIHYHSPVERFSGAKGRSKCDLAAHKESCDFSFRNESDQRLDIKQIDLAGSDISSRQRMWQHWHYDYGIFTVVAAPMFRVAPNSFSHKMEGFSSSSTADPSALAECLPPDGHSCLCIMNPSTGLAQHVVVSDDLLIVQVGEAAQILSGGKLRATAHCVSELVSKSNVSRETFVLFLQPSWQKPLVPPEGYDRSMVLGAVSWVDEENSQNKLPDFSPSTPRSSILAFNKSVPPLASRWQECFTFAEFSKQTTRQYYGAKGCQSSH